MIQSHLFLLLYIILHIAFHLIYLISHYHMPSTTCMELEIHTRLKLVLLHVHSANIA